MIDASAIFVSAIQIEAYSIIRDKYMQRPPNSLIEKLTMRQVVKYLEKNSSFVRELDYSDPKFFEHLDKLRDEYAHASC